MQFDCTSVVARSCNLVAPISVLFLAACGGSSSTTPTYNALNAGASATPAVVPLTGSAVRYETATDSLASQSVTGTVTRASEVLALNDGVTTFQSTGGPDGSGVYTGTAAGTSVQPIDAAYISGTYDYVLPYRHEDAASISLGVAGYGTEAAHVPNSGVASYQGEGMIITNDGLTVRQHRSGTTSVAVDFGAGTADVIMTGVTVPASAAAAVVDDVRITGAAVGATGFSGGTVAATLGGVDALPGITGGGDTVTASGHFYGYDASLSGPDEVAGTLLVDGNTGSLQATFVTD